MRHGRSDVVAGAIRVLDERGLADLSMRTLGAELGVRASALYHHFPDKRALLAAVADELMLRVRRGAEVVTWDAEVELICVELRAAATSCRDASLLLAEVYGERGAGELHDRLAGALARGGVDAPTTALGARMLVRHTLAHRADDGRDFARGIGILLDGLRAQASYAR